LTQHFHSRGHQPRYSTMATSTSLSVEWARGYTKAGELCMQHVTSL
jgi:hypothetical protein